MFDSLSLLLYSVYYESKITRTELLAQETEHEEEGTLETFEVSFIGLQLHSSPILQMLSAQEMSWSSHSRSTEENTYQTSKTLPHLNSFRMVSPLSYSSTTSEQLNGMSLSGQRQPFTSACWSKPNGVLICYALAHFITYRYVHFLYIACGASVWPFSWTFSFSGDGI